MKIIKNILLMGFAAIFVAIIINGCATQAKIASEKTGSQLWGQNCSRCHNAPPVSTYSSDQWEVLALHMKVRAMIHDRDIKKIEGFLKEGSK